ncbi:MAG TPA: hypothetical protein VHA80_01255, partial [Solirubrobacterales bacterium]|nr:hypothetical protein [Solirubrobacterales bacterium]
MGAGGDSTFIDPSRIGTADTTVAVKDIVDLAGLTTTAGVGRGARRRSGRGHAACMAGLRATIEGGEAAIDRALAEAELEVVEVELPSWRCALEAAFSIGLPEAARNNGALADRYPAHLLDRTRAAIALGRELAPGRPRPAASNAPGKPSSPPSTRPSSWPGPPRQPSHPRNLAGLPALAQPVRTPGRLPASLQLVGPRSSSVVEAAGGGGGTDKLRGACGCRG